MNDYTEQEFHEIRRLHLGGGLNTIIARLKRHDERYAGLGNWERFKNWWFDARIWRDDPARQVIAIAREEVLYEQDVIEGEDFRDSNTHGVRNRIPKIAAHFARCARNELEIEFTEADRMVVKSYIYKLMKMRGMRTSHITMCLPLAVTLSFLKTEYEIQADMASATHEYNDIVSKGDRGWYTRGRPWVFNWFGSKTTRPRMRPE